MERATGRPHGSTAERGTFSLFYGRKGNKGMTRTIGTTSTLVGGAYS